MSEGGDVVEVAGKLGLFEAIAAFFKKAAKVGAEDTGRDVEQDLTKDLEQDLERDTGKDGPFRGPSQNAPGGQAGPPVSIKQLKMELGRAGMSVKDYDIVHAPEITTPEGLPAYGRSPHDFNGQPELGPSGRPKIEISNIGLSNMNEAVTTIFHEIYHHMSFARTGLPGGEGPAEEYGLRMLKIFLNRSG
jgi:hypothetical protein